MTSIYLGVLFAAHEPESSRSFAARRRVRDLRLLLGLSSGPLVVDAGDSDSWSGRSGLKLAW